MTAKRYKPEEIIMKQREAEMLPAKGVMRKAIHV